MRLLAKILWFGGRVGYTQRAVQARVSDSIANILRLLFVSPFLSSLHKAGTDSRVRGARAFSLCSFRKTHEQHQKYPYSFSRKKLNKLLEASPPSLRLKEPQTKLTLLIPPERLQEMSWQDFWRSHVPGALVLITYVNFPYLFFRPGPS